jgi:alkanesulfonate monooxygenase SsuD/methylene tetrahydromethanopterin reductase-like flavin-dependent oxidoreductase (luciferase family)
VFGEHQPGQTNVWEEFQEHRNKFGFAREIVRAEGETLGVKLLEQGLGSMRGAVGTPKQIIDLVERYEVAGVDQVIFVAQCGNNVHEEVCESLELFGREVVPHFADKADDVERAKAERLSSAIERALARREASREPAADYVVRPDGEPSPARTWQLSSPVGDPDDPAEQFLSQLRGKSDDELLGLVQNAQVLEVILHGMASRFDPQYARGFTGDIQYNFQAGNETKSYFVTVEKDSAEVHEGTSQTPAVTVAMPAPTYLRIASGEENGAIAMMEGRIGLEGDTKVAIRLGEMFGQSRY